MLRKERTAERPASAHPGPRARSNVMLGVVTGALGLGCCVYPVVLVLVGLSSASGAIILGNRLYSEWGWAFKLAAAGFAGAAIVVQRRRARACGIDRPGGTLKSATIVVGTGLATYAVLYLATRGLASLAA